VMIFDAQTCLELHRLIGHTDLITNVAWSPPGDLLATTSWDGTAIIWGVNSP